MKERPILMRGPLVCASLKDAKWQTRRAIVPTQSAPRVAPLRMEPWIIDGEQETDDHGLPCWAGYHPDYPGEAKWFSCPYGKPGDRLWVREAFAIVPTTAYRASTGVHQTVNPCDPDDAAIYRAGWDRSPPGVRWRPSIHMPRWASRLTLQVTAVRVERVQDITPEDCRSEGIACLDVPRTAWRNIFSRLWNEINAKRGYGWSVNPWVWVISYTRVTT
jgi:hypothetical protein